MSRLDKLKREAINEANIRVLNEQDVDAGEEIKRREREEEEVYEYIFDALNPILEKIMDKYSNEQHISYMIKTAVDHYIEMEYGYDRLKGL